MKHDQTLLVFSLRLEAAWRGSDAQVSHSSSCVEGKPARGDPRTDANDAAAVADSSLLRLFSSVISFSFLFLPSSSGSGRLCFHLLFITDNRFQFSCLFLLHSNQINIVCDSRRFQMLAYFNKATVSPPTLASGGSVNVAAPQRAGESTKLEAASGVEQRQTRSSSSSDCQQQMQSEAFRERKSRTQPRLRSAAPRRRLAAPQRR